MWTVRIPVTTYFNDSIIEEMSIISENEGGEEALGAAGDNDNKSAVTKASVNAAGGFLKRKSIDKKDVNYTQVPMDITSPPDAKVARETVDSNENLSDDHTEALMKLIEERGPTGLVEMIDKKKRFSSDVDYTPVPMDITSPVEKKKNHLITCPVCFEIAILCKNSTLYDNLIYACMEQRSKQ